MLAVVYKYPFQCIGALFGVVCVFLSVALIWTVDTQRRLDQLLLVEQAEHQRLVHERFKLERAVFELNEERLRFVQELELLQQQFPDGRVLVVNP